MKSNSRKERDEIIAAAFIRSTDRKGKYLCLFFGVMILVSLAGFVFSLWNISQTTEHMQILGFIVLIIICLASIYGFGAFFTIFFEGIAKTQIAMERWQRKTTPPPTELKSS